VKIDGRTLSHETSEAIRKMAVKRVLEGEAPSSVMRSYGLCRTTIYRWLRAHKSGGEEALTARPTTGRPPTLSEDQKSQMRRWICGKDPRQYGFGFGLWTRRIVVDLVAKKFNKKLSVTAVDRLLAELEVTPQKTLRCAYERDPVAIIKWKKEDYPKLKARAKRRGADIFFLDEAGVRSDAALQRTWGAKGETPIVATSGQRAANTSEAFWYDVYTGKFNAELFITKLKAFMRHRRRPVFLVLDGHPAHRAKIVAAYVQSLKGHLELHFLPGYASDLIPDKLGS
jgi:transposase